MKHRALQILEELVAIPSVNPAYIEAAHRENARGEADMADYVEAFGQRLGLKTTRQNVFPGRDNILIECRADALSTRKTLLFESHMDTVSVGSTPQPFSPRIEGGKMWGRGACDTKATMAGMLCVLEEISQNPAVLPCDVAFLATVDEEVAQRGAVAFARDLPFPIHGAIVGEPTEMRLIGAHKGVTRMAVTTRGKAAHSSVPHEGDSAIYQMLRVLTWLENQETPRLQKLAHPLCGEATLVVGQIRGGTQVNIVPEECEIEIDRRVLPGESAARVLSQFRDDLQSAMLGQNVNAEVRELLLCEPLSNDEDAEIIGCARRVLRAMNLDDAPTGVPYASDASALSGAGVPTILFGPGSIAQAHTSDEWVPLDEVEQATDFYRQMAFNFGR